MTKRLYYDDSHMNRFSAKVISCRKAEGGYEILLDRTAFFPEGGGQPSDTGTLGGVSVLHVSERDGQVVHLTEDALEEGAAVEGALDWSKRFHRMQAHSGEHIVSGVVHAKYGYNNVGFHMGADGVIVDFDGFLTPEELLAVETEANRIVTADVPVTTGFPPAEELPNMDYRSKLELTENVRLVNIRGCDLCACCAPHVSHTGEVGLVKILDSIHRKNGVRIRMLAGEAALEDYRQKAKSVSEISALLSAKAEAVTPAVERILKEKEKLSWSVGRICRRLAEALAVGLEETSGNILFFEPLFDTEGLRMLVNNAMPSCGGICAAFSGSDEEGYQYVMGSRSHDMCSEAAAINTALSGRGGGTRTMIQGSVRVGRTDIEKFFACGSIIL